MVETEGNARGVLRKDGWRWVVDGGGESRSVGGNTEGGYWLRSGGAIITGRKPRCGGYFAYGDHAHDVAVFEGVGIDGKQFNGEVGLLGNAWLMRVAKDHAFSLSP